MSGTASSNWQDTGHDKPGMQVRFLSPHPSGRRLMDDQYSPAETEQRLRKTLRAAFNMKPTPLKAIPRKRGKAQPSRSAPRRTKATASVSRNFPKVG
jgi:hypothetical protein